MSSGEVLFILAFIILPTAVLVSSAWAILFVRRRPDRTVEQQVEDPQWKDTSTADDHTVIQDTAVLNTAATGKEEPASATIENDETVQRHDDTETIEEEPSEEPLVIAPVAMPEPELEPVPDEESRDDTVVQATDDLDAVVAEVRASEVEEQPVVGPEPELELEPETLVYDTTELPVIERPEPRPVEPEPQPVLPPELLEEPQEPDPEEESGSRWKRRKRPGQLRPADPDASRQRGRNRDSQRQVPQLGRSSRRRDGSQRDASQNPEKSGDTP
ncbi:hypothetical protein BH23CHL1_BH23CHL1_25640 [soil metagenome]